MSARRSLGSVFLAALAFAACGTQGPDRFGVVVAPQRHGTVIADTCPLTSDHFDALAMAGARAHVSDVVLLCLLVDNASVVWPSDAAGQAVLQSEVNTLRGEGYRVTLGFALGDPQLPLAQQQYDATQVAGLLANRTWVDATAQALANFIVVADGWEVAMQLQTTSTQRSDLTNFIQALAVAVHPSHTLNLFAPPSAMMPSDIPGGGMYDISSLSAAVDRIRLMTLDFSAGDHSMAAMPGPAIDTGWAAQVGGLAHSLVGATPVDISVQLYGTDFGSHGSTDVTYQDALAVGRAHNVTPTREASGDLHVEYLGSDGAHALWYQDAQTIGGYLSTWTVDVLPPDVGIVFYGLGSEDPAVWNMLNMVEQP